jgi:hypothetical protein
MTSPISDILKPYHDYSCHSSQRWIKGMTEPFPCDCSVSEAYDAILALLNEAIGSSTQLTLTNGTVWINEKVLRAKLGITGEGDNE